MLHKRQKRQWKKQKEESLCDLPSFNHPLEENQCPMMTLSPAPKKIMQNTHRGKNLFKTDISRDFYNPNRLIIIPIRPT
jgi:hypothetical protein